MAPILMILNIATIPHSGSRLLVDGIIKQPWQSNIHEAKEGVNFFTHILMHNANVHARRFEEYPTIVALRHPLLVATSWKKRKKEISEMCVCWYILAEILDKYDPYYLPVDHKDRDKYLNQINQGLGLNLETEWPLINSKHHTFKPEDLGEDHEQVERLCENIKPFLQKIYPRRPRRGNRSTNSRKGTAKVRHIAERRNG